MTLGIVLGCGHYWMHDGSDPAPTVEEASDVAALCAAMGDTSYCESCGQQQPVTAAVVEVDE